MATTPLTLKAWRPYENSRHLFPLIIGLALLQGQVHLNMYTNPTTMARPGQVPANNAPTNLSRSMRRMPQRLPSTAPTAAVVPGAVPKQSSNPTNIGQMLPPPEPAPQGILVPEALALSACLQVSPFPNILCQVLRRDSRRPWILGSCTSLSERDRNCKYIRPIQ